MAKPEQDPTKLPEPVMIEVKAQHKLVFEKTLELMTICDALGNTDGLDQAKRHIHEARLHMLWHLQPFVNPNW